MVQRTLQKKISEKFFKGKIILLFGARQVGKTTLVQEIARESGLPTLWLNGDEPDVREDLSNTSSTRLKAIIGSKKLVIIDEAQRISNIGLSLKLIADNIKDTQVIATGSSAFELSSEINEPLTGRKFEYKLFPLSFKEMCQNSSIREEKRLLEHRLVYGYYPEVVTHPGDEKEILNSLAQSYLFKDLFTLGQIKKPAMFEKLVQALAFQAGNLVSYNELGQLIGADNETVERYIDLMEKAFIVFRLGALSRNLRNELKKSRKIYFFDNGIRNAVINNYSSISMRPDVGALWENFLISERIKFVHYSRRYVNNWFWRTHAQQEIDYVEESDGKLEAFEFKWNARKKAQFPKTFLNAYPNCGGKFITKENYTEFIS